MPEKIDYADLYYPPGGILIWILIFLELITFGAALVGLVVSSRENPAEFYHSRMLLNTYYGTLNTLFLLTGGYFMAQAVQSAKKTFYRQAGKNTMFAIISGLLFILLKSFEYYEKIEHGLTLGYNTFFNFYWLLTGFHVIHVIVGLVILAFMYRSLTKPGANPDILNIEAGAHFWHMVDLIWLLLFPTLYLIL